MAKRPLFPVKRKYTKKVATKATKRATKVGKKRGRQPGSKNKPKEQHSNIENGSIISLLPPRERANAVTGVIQEMKKEEASILRKYLTAIHTTADKMVMLGRLKHLAEEISTLSLFLKVIKSPKNA